MKTTVIKRLLACMLAAGMLMTSNAAISMAAAAAAEAVAEAQAAQAQAEVLTQLAYEASLRLSDGT